MTFRHLLLMFGCAAALAVYPAERSATLSMSTSVVWGACASWSDSTPTTLQPIRGRAFERGPH